LTDKLVNAEQTQTLGGVLPHRWVPCKISKTYVMAAATGTFSSSGFVWLVTHQQKVQLLNLA
jgi:hypothetical protein